MNPYADVDARLIELALHLEDAQRRRLLQILQADARAVTLVELEQKLQRSEDLVEELRRQMGSLQRQRDRMRDALAVEDVDLDQLRATFAIPTRPRGEWAASRTEP